MIRFKCPCGQPLTAEMDDAGSSLQCPRCKRLLDVPTLDDLPNLNDDGTYVMGDIEMSAAQKDKRRSFRSIHTTGGDLRPSAEDILRVGVPTEDHGPTRPRYDPFTGELVRPMSVIETPLTAIPVTAQGARKDRNALTYSSEAWRKESFLSPISWLLKPANVIVLGTLFLVHAVTLLVLPLPMIGVIALIFVGPFMLMLLLSHYANIVDTTGPEGNNELPILFRGGSFSLDIWHPFTQMAFSLMLVLAPGILTAYHTWNMGIGGRLGLLISAALLPLFPAIALISTTSGTFWNLLPHRLAGTIRACGWRYWIVVAVTAASFVTFAVSAILVAGAMRLVIGTVVISGLPAGLISVMGLTLLGVSVYLLHLNFFLLGMLYRREHERFPWMLQRHISTRSDTAIKLEAARRQRAIDRGHAAAKTLPPA